MFLNETTACRLLGIWTQQKKFGLTLTLLQQEIARSEGCKRQIYHLAAAQAFKHKEPNISGAQSDSFLESHFGGKIWKLKMK